MRTWIVVVAMALISSHAQNSPPLRITPASQETDRGPHLGRPVLHPEAVSGVWEAPDGEGGAVGIHLRLSTIVPGDAKTLADTPQSLEQLDVGVYQRKGPEIQLGEENFFSGTPRGGSVTLEDGHLLLYSSAHLDLVQQPGDRWVGRLLRGSFDSTVTLRRPGPADPDKTSPVVGTWLESSATPSAYSCVHIVQQAENSFIGWSDSLEAPASTQCPNGVRKLATLYERYGERMKVHLEADGKVSLELYAYNPMCCSHTFIGTISPNGKVIQGTWPTGPNQSPHNGSWKKVPGDSCLSQAPSQAR
jgi:hypothetical protein